LRTDDRVAALDVIPIARQQIAKRQVVVLDCAAGNKADEIIPDAAEPSGLLQELASFDRLLAQMPVG
jgi:hypothetical protein